MDRTRIDEWIKNSYCIQYVEILLLGEFQALGELDVWLINELQKIKIKSRLKRHLPKKRRYLLLSKLWVIGAYELIRVIKQITKNKDNIEKNMKEKINETLTLFNEIRVPIAKFEKQGNNRLYSGVADSFIDPVKGVGWKVYEYHQKELKKKIFYRRDLGDELLELLKSLSIEIFQK